MLATGSCGELGCASVGVIDSDELTGCGLADDDTALCVTPADDDGRSKQTRLGRRTVSTLTTASL